MPSLLPDESPEGYTWDEPSALQVQYQYTFMPKGIISRLIVRQHGLLESTPVMWKRGAVMSDNGARIEVTESYRDKRINIRSNGHGRNAKELMMTVAREIDLLNRSFHFNERMRVEQKIPCNCPVCKELTIPHYFLRSNLDKADRVKQKVQCQESFEMIDVRALLDGVFASEGSKINRSTIEGLIELGELKEALEAMKSEYPDAVLFLSELTSSEKAFTKGLIDFEVLGKIKARLRLAALQELAE